MVFLSAKQEFLQRIRCYRSFDTPEPHRAARPHPHLDRPSPPAGPKHSSRSVTIAGGPNTRSCPRLRFFNLCSLAISAADQAHLPRSADRVTLAEISGPAPGFGEEPIPFPSPHRPRMQRGGSDVAVRLTLRSAETRISG